MDEPAATRLYTGQRVELGKDLDTEQSLCLRKEGAGGLSFNTEQMLT